MTYQPLTKEQYEQARKQFSHTQIMEMEQKRKSESVKTPIKSEPNAAQQIGQSAVGSLLVRPAVRTGQAIASIGVQAFGSEETKNRLDEALQQPTSVNMGPLGTYEVPPVKAGTAAARQLTGETLEAASWLYGPTKAAQSVNVGLMQGIIRSGGFLAKHGAIGGGMFGLGEGLQGEGDAADVFEQTAVGAGAGALGGAVLGSALPVAPILASKMSQGAHSLQGMAAKGLEVGSTAMNAAKSVGEGVMNVPLRVGDRAIEATQKVAQRQATMKAAAPHIRDAMKHGVPDDWVKIATHGDSIDKVVRADMLELAKAGTDVTSKTPRPVSKVGEQINQGPVKHLIGVKDEGVARTKQVLDALPKEPVDISNIRNQFLEDMNAAGLAMTDEGKLVIQPGGRIPQSDVRFYQEVLDDFSAGKLTYQQMHHMRQKYFDTAKSDQMFTGGTTSYAQRMRSFLTKEIDDLSGGQYYEAQVKTREAMEVLSEYAKLLGYKGDVERLTAKDLKSGETFLRVFGNASDRPMTVLDDVYTRAQKYGYAGTEDIMVQLRFADMLEDVYGAQARSLGGQVSRATVAADPQQTVASGVREMVKWSPYSGAIRLARASGLLGKRPEDIMRAFENMILTEAGRPMQVQPVSPIREAIKNVSENLRKTGEDAMDNYLPMNDGPIKIIPTKKAQAVPKDTKFLNVAREELSKLQDQIGIKESVLAENNARLLMRYVGKGDNTLSEVNYRNMGTEKKTARLDDLVNELGYKDLNEAQDAVDSYVRQRDALRAQKAELRTLKQQVREGEDVLTYDDPKYFSESQMFAGGAAGFEKDDQGNVTFDMNKALLGMAGMVGAQRLPKAEILKRLRTSLPKQSKDEMARFVEVVKGGLYKTGKDSKLQFVDKEAKDAFYAGLEVVHGKPMLEDRMAHATPGRIANLFDEILTTK